MNCTECNGSGLKPFKNKNGVIVKNAYTFCSCHPIYGANAHYSVPVATEGKRPPTRAAIPKGRAHLYEDDFDFPMSYSVYRSLCREHGWEDPGAIESQPKPIPEPLANLTPEEWEDKLHHMQVLVNDLMIRLNKHIIPQNYEPF